MDKKLTIIIPTYNMELHLRRCLDSLLIGDEMKALEVIIVNDGSSDHSSIIGHEYVSTYPETFRILDKENGNYGSCINAGLKLASGKYVKILDSDDFYDTSCLISFIKKLRKVDTDAVISNYSLIQGDEKISKEYPYLDNQVINLDSEVPTLLQMHGLVYKLSLLKQISYYQTEGISYTDQEWIFYPMFYVKDICFFNENLYQYVLGRKGQTMDAEVFKKRIHMLEQIVLRMLNYSQTNQMHLSSSRKKYLEYIIYSQIKRIYDVELISRSRKICNVQKLKEVDHALLEYSKDLYFSFQKPFYKRFYIVLFRRNCYLPNFIRKILQEKMGL